MDCNFYDDYERLFQKISWEWEIFSFILYILNCSLATLIISIILGIPSENYVDGVIEHNNFPFVPILIIFLFGYFIFKSIMLYKEYKKNKSEFCEFTFRMFKDWYSLSPKRFVFDRDGYGFHYMVNGNPDYVNEDLRVCSYSSSERERIDNNYNYLVPKTFLDYLKFTVFVELLFRENEGKAKKKKKIEIKRKNNEELLTILNVVQSDIEKVLNDSQGIINQETGKLEIVNMD